MHPTLRNALVRLRRLFDGSTLRSTRRTLLNHNRREENDLELNGRLELRKSAIALHLLQKGDAAIDVGAFIGSYALFYADLVGPEGLVIACEPEPRAFGRLLLRQQGRHLPQLQNWNKVISETGKRRVEMMVFEEKIAPCCTVEPTLMNSERMPGATHKISVQTETLDAMEELLASKKLTLLKIDTEGHEEAVLRGGQKLIASHRPFILFEYGFSPGRFEPRTIEHLMAQNYRCFDVRTLQNVQENYISEEATDLLAVPGEKFPLFYPFFSALR